MPWKQWENFGFGSMFVFDLYFFFFLCCCDLGLCLISISDWVLCLSLISVSFSLFFRLCCCDLGVFVFDLYFFLLLLFICVVMIWVWVIGCWVCVLVIWVEFFVVGFDWEEHKEQVVMFVLMKINNDK